MNRLILISTPNKRGFQPIISGKVSLYSGVFPELSFKGFNLSAIADLNTFE
ncbi:MULTISPECIES: hypothetical protein [unclassified Microcoleus]|uniref:hypothetical protein n=1 Tax=unclassified Microcoleus TaxID=2642155 RepID=UPI0025F3670C|nr:MULTISPECIES: hypothetical protein [unclassified Microcoleus]